MENNNKVDSNDYIENLNKTFEEEYKKSFKNMLMFGMSGNYISNTGEIKSLSIDELLKIKTNNNGNI